MATSAQAVDMVRTLPWYCVILGSGAMLAAALGFQHLGGLFPCELCLWQRWPHGLAIVLAGIHFARPTPLIATMGLVVMLGGAAIAGFHAGVEMGLWAGLAGCSGGVLTGLTGAELLDADAPIRIARCDEVAWSFLGLSMAAWNGLLSLGLAAMWLVLARNARSGTIKPTESRVSS